jgi:hypothetical protein
MIAVRDIPEPGTTDLFEDGLLHPVPGDKANEILLEARDGNNVKVICAKRLKLKRGEHTELDLSDIRIDVYITDARVALACSKYDKGGGWSGFGAGAFVAVALNAGSKALATRRRRGKMLVGQVRYAWLAGSGSSSKTGWLSEEQLVLTARTEGGFSSLTLTLPKDVDAASVAAEVARRSASHRLSCEPTLADDERASLERLAGAERLGPAKGKIRNHVFPTSWHVGEKSARMSPRADGSVQDPVSREEAVHLGRSAAGEFRDDSDGGDASVCQRV